MSDVNNGYPNAQIATAISAEAVTLRQYAGDIDALTTAIDTLHDERRDPHDRTLYGARESVIESASELQGRVGDLRDAINRQHMLTGERKDALAKLNESLGYIAGVLRSSKANNWGYRIPDAGAPEAVVTEWNGHWHTIRHTAIQIRNWATAMVDTGSDKKRKQRMKREVAEPLINQRLTRKPHDTAQEVADAVGCGKGTVVQSPGWRANQKRLNESRKTGKDPIALPLEPYLVEFVSVGQQEQAHRDQEAIDDRIDQEQRELYARIEEYRKNNPEASPQEIAQAVGCTAGDVERRQAMLNKLVGDQDQNNREAHDPKKPVWKQRL